MAFSVKSFYQSKLGAKIATIFLIFYKTFYKLFIWNSRKNQKIVEIFAPNADNNIRGDKIVKRDNVYNI